MLFRLLRNSHKPREVSGTSPAKLDLNLTPELYKDAEGHRSGLDENRQAWQAVRQRIADLQMPAEIVELDRSLLDGLLARELSGRSSLVERDRLTRACDRLADLYADGEITRDQYNTKKGAYQAELDSLDAALPVPLDVLAALELGKEALTAPPAAFRALAVELYVRIMVMPDGTLDYQAQEWAQGWAFSFCHQTAAALRTSRRPRQVSGKRKAAAFWLNHMNTINRFWIKVKIAPNGCWEWMGGKHPKGYGFFSIGLRKLYAHRFSYEHFVGPIPDGLQIDHLCRNRGCVNPSHMEPVTNRENTLRGVGPTAILAAATHCIHGHEFNAQNTYVGKQGKRYCRACNREQHRQNRA